MSDKPSEPLRAASDPPKPSSEPSPRSEPKAPPASSSEPGPEQAPHEHGDDAGVHPDGPKHYHDDFATSRRM